MFTLHMKKLIWGIFVIALLILAIQAAILLNLTASNKPTASAPVKIITQSEPCFVLQNANGWKEQSQSGNQFFLINQNYPATIEAQFFPISSKTAHDGYENLLIANGWLSKNRLSEFSLNAYPNLNLEFPFVAVRKSPAAATNEVMGDHDMAIIAQDYRDFVGFFALLTDGKNLPDLDLINQLTHVARNFVPSCQQ